MKLGNSPGHVFWSFRLTSCNMTASAPAPAPSEAAVAAAANTGGAAGEDANALDDLAGLPELNDESVLSGVKVRYHANKIYTQVSSLLIAMNPYQQLPIYTTDMMAEYKSATVGTLPPHVFGIAAAAYSGLLGLRSQASWASFTACPLRGSSHLTVALTALFFTAPSCACSRSSSRASPELASLRQRKRFCSTLPSARRNAASPTMGSRRASSRRVRSSRRSATRRRR